MAPFKKQLYNRKEMKWNIALLKGDIISFVSRTNELKVSNIIYTYFPIFQVCLLFL